ncbi:MAG: GAF domain-containing protein [Nocardioides sp.]|nr:GAF domain-containing protein [Nocardioides sp.]
MTSSTASPDDELGSRARALLDAVIAISSDLDLTSVLTRIVKAATSLTGARYGALGVLGSDGELVEFITIGIDARSRELIGPLPRGHGILGVITEDARGLRLGDLSAHPSSVGFPPNHPPMRTFLGMPVRIRGTVFGNLYLTEKEGGEPFSEADERLVEELARTAGFVIANARAYGLSERRRQWLEASADLSEILEPPTDLDEAFTEIVRVIRTVSQARAVSLWSGTGPAEDRIAIAPGDDDDALRAALAKVRARTTLIPGGPVLTTHVDHAPVVVVPLRSHLAPVQAVVAITPPDSPLLDVEERELFAGFADQVALTLDRATALGDRQELAVISDRERIARDLHDIVIQRLFATGLQLQGVSAITSVPEVAARIDAAVGDLDDTIKAIRGTIFELQDRTGDSLRGEIRSLVKDYVPILGFTPAVRTSGPIDTAVPAELGTQLLAVLREAISNVARHALADTAQVDLVVNQDRLELRVADDGVGVPDEVSESGLRNARRRAVDLGGSMEISRVGTRGTVLTWRVPLHPPQ